MNATGRMSNVLIDSKIYVKQLTIKMLRKYL